MALEPVNILHIVYIVQACFGILLIANQSRYRGLIWLLAAAALLMVFNILEETNTTREFHLVSPIFALIFGPLLYLFVHQLIYSKLKPLSARLLHLLPAAAALPFTDWTQSILLLGTFSQLIYIIVSIQLIRHYHQAALAYRSDADSLKLSWITKILIIIALTSIVDLARLNLQPYLSLGILKPWYFIMQTIFFLIVSTLIYKAIRQPALFEGLAQYEKLQAMQQENLNAEIIFKELDQLLKTSRLYQQARLSLRDLADKTGFNEKEISGAINQIAQKNFCDYINSLRVNEIKKQLNDKTSEQSSLLNIALEAGFSSKSTFNAAFKRETGMTPSQYQQ